MTEKEAREKWCPHARLISIGRDGDESSGNRYEQDSPLTNCYASDCMMWRWNEDQFSWHDGAMFNTPQCPVHKTNWAPFLSRSKSVNDRIVTGYCGLAGKP